MNKTIKAILHGYILFCCNGRYFLRYNSAKAYIPVRGSYEFDGLHVWKGWRCFSLRIEPNPAIRNLATEL